jgi:hypothetical protein
MAGCAAGLSPAPDLGGLYNRAAQGGDATRNPVIYILRTLGVGGYRDETLAQDLGFTDNLFFRLLDSPRVVTPRSAARTQP